jgi:hypothetical protein
MDAIRLEVREDLLIEENEHPDARKEYLKRSVERYQKLLNRGVCFIDDSSADRSWKQQEGDQFYQLQKHKYDHFIISMDMSLDFIKKLHQANKSVLNDQVERFYNDHQKFLELYKDDAGVHIHDENFLDRMNICERAVKVFLFDRGYKF